MSKKNFLVTDKSIFHDDFNTFFKKYVVSNYHDDLIDIEESFKKELNINFRKDKNSENENSENENSENENSENENSENENSEN